MELAFRERLKKMRGTKSRAKFAEELEMTKAHYSMIERGASNPTIKTLQRMAELTNSTLVIDLVPKETEQMELKLENKQQ